MGNREFQRTMKESISCDQLKLILKLYGMAYNCGDDLTVDMIFKLPWKIREIIVWRIAGDTRALKALVVLFKKTHYVAEVDFEQLRNQFSFNPTKALKGKPFCKLHIPTCKAGKVLHHSFYKEPIWTHSYGYNCKPCKEKFYKPELGNIHNCTKCVYPNTTDTNRTQCYDPYRMVLLDPKSLINVLVMLAPSGLILGFVIGTAILFIVNRNTPIVLSANRQMTSIQLIVHSLLFVMPNVLFFTPATRLVCIGRQLLLGFAFSITISINISKSQKLYMIVGKNILMSKSEIMLTRASEWLIIVVVLIFNAVLHLFTFLQKAATVKVKYHDDLLIKEVYCTNSNIIYLQILFASFLAACNGVQGFRARKLPSHFKETNHVIYSSFISIVVSIAATALYFSQSQELRKEFLTLAVTIIFNTVHFVLLYGFKVYIMLFKPQLNTKKAFAQKRLEKVGSNPY